jgi:hypothetical protein
MLTDETAQCSQISARSTTHKYLAEVGKDVGLETLVIANPGITSISPGMVATTLLAIIGLTNITPIGDQDLFSLA